VLGALGLKALRGGPQLAESGGDFTLVVKLHNVVIGML